MNPDIPRWHSVSEARYKETISQYKDESLNGLSISNNFKVGGKVHFIEWSYHEEPFAALFQFQAEEHYWIYGTLVPALQTNMDRGLAEGVKALVEKEAD